MCFGDNDLLLPQFRPGGNDNKNHSGRLRDSRKKKRENNILLKTEDPKEKKS